MSLARRMLLVSLWLVTVLIVLYQAGLALIGIYIFHSRADGLGTLVLYSPLLYIPTLVIAAYRLRAGVYAGWVSFAVYHAVLCAISWPHVAGLMVDLTVDWELLIVSVLLVIMRYLCIGADPRVPRIRTNPRPS